MLEFLELKHYQNNKQSLASWVKDKIRIKNNPFSFYNHAYLRQLYNDNSDIIVIQKAVQLGISTYATCRAFWLCDMYEEDTIYNLPTKEWANRISGRMKEDIIKYSPAILALMDSKSLDAKETRIIGAGTLSYRGLKSPSGTQETPADQVVIDETDFITDFKRIGEAFDRLAHSIRKWKIVIGIPSIENYGINAYFKKSTQYHWNLTCECGNRIILEESFPECLKRIDNKTVIRICPVCRKKLDTQNGKWIAKYPDREVHGYLVSQLYSELVNPHNILDFWERLESGENLEPGEDKETFYRQIIGVPYLSAENQLTANEIIACCRNKTPEDINKSKNFMGIDTGKVQWFFIGRKNKDNDGFETIKTGSANFDELESYMDLYNINRCVIDPGGNITKADEFTQKFKGRVYQCYYVNNPKVFVEFNKDKLQVSANRTKTLDHSGEIIRNQKLTLLPRQLPAVGFFIKHCVNSIKVSEEDPDTGIKTFRYIRRGPDHLRHALNYFYIATQKKVSSPRIWRA